MALADDLKERGDIDLSECFIDGMFIVAVADASGLSVAIDIASASSHEITLVEPLLERGCFMDAPER